MITAITFLLWAAFIHFIGADSLGNPLIVILTWSYSMILAALKDFSWAFDGKS